MLQDSAAERAVLSGIFKGRDYYLEVADILQDDTFVDLANQAIFKSVKHLFEVKNVDKIDEMSVYTSAHELGYKWLFDERDNVRYIKGIFNANIDISNVRKLGAKIRKLHIARLMKDQLVLAGEELSEIKGNESLDVIIGLVEGRIFDFSTLLQSQMEEAKPSLIGEGLEDYIEHLRKNPVEMVGISTGFPRYDKAIGGGLRRKTVSMVGARTGIGKGQFGLNVTLHVTQNLKIPVLYLDTEMSKEDHYHRSVANISNVDIDLIETGKFGKDIQADYNINQAVNKLKALPYTYISVAGKQFEEIISIMRRWLNKNVGLDENGNTKDCLIIYDYLKLMSSESITTSLAEFQVLGFQMTGLHNFAVRHDVPILSFIQLNRDGIDKETTASASGSDRIVWLASNLSIFKPKSDEEIENDGEENGNRKLIPLKVRHGRGLNQGDYISMKFDGNVSRIKEIGTRSELKRKQAASNPNIVDVDSTEEIKFGQTYDSDNGEELL